MKKLSYLLFCILCALILYQDFIGIFLFNLGIPKYLLQIFLSLKDIIVILMIMLNFMTAAVVRKNFSLNLTLFFFIGYTVIVGAYFFNFGGTNTIANNTNNLRSLVFPVYAYIAGYTSFYLKKEDMTTVLERIALFSVALSLGLYILGYGFLIHLRVLDYTQDIRGYFGLIFKGLPSAYFTSLGKTAIFRLAGPVFNSVGTAVLYTFVLSISLAYYRFVKKSKFRLIMLIFLALSIFLTFSRGAIFGLVLGLLFTDILYMTKDRDRKPLLIIYSILLCFFIIFYNKLSGILRETFLLTDSSARGHYNALIISWDYLKQNWMGGGIGSIGMWGSADYTGGAGENSLVFIIGQVGIFAAVVLAMAYINILRNLLRNRREYINYGLLICAIAVFFNSMFAPSLLVVTPLLLFWFFVGHSEGIAATKVT